MIVTQKVGHDNHSHHVSKEPPCVEIATKYKILAIRDTKKWEADI